ncbi:DUF3027 domain-containing protein [Sinomonas sp. ASV486]|uniref:DUF3027 domain-containing protein n=1 Tax=Sinomonas sp. ASV486 TaxID=3051170 RepID=UPI0027DB63C9|nr:DUF3027 domain-containing protein [Sinomonas sp. ASV486]MDQ4490889.1 DUF3027 domain-containing protein [Sinomonas sp. ASV486]
MTDAAPAAAAPEAEIARPAAKRKAGVPIWRVGKPDSILAAAVDTARDALAAIARPEDIGSHIAAKSEGERVVTHLFECRLRGYRGWQWFVTVARVARSKVATVNEIGLVPSEGSLLAPEWLPWSERIRPEERDAAAHGDDAAPEDSEQDAAETHDDGAAATSHDDGPQGPDEHDD